MKDSRLPYTKAKKSLGQHFLRSERVIKRIVDAGEIVPGELIVEVGPGYGVLTKALLAAGARVIAIEADHDLAAELRERFSAELRNGQLEIVVGDVLRLARGSELRELLRGKYKVIANIPYFITGALFRLFLQELPQPTNLIFLVQKEVAEEIVGRNGKTGILSLAVHAYGVPRYLGIVRREAFVPPPKVDSAIIRVENISHERLRAIGEEDFFQIIRAGLGARRKMLLGNLAKSLKIPRAILLRIFAELDIPATARGEDLTIEKWIAITGALQQMRVAQNGGDHP